MTTTTEAAPSATAPTPAPAATPAATPAPAATAPTPAPAAPAPAQFPATWREDWAKGDEKALTRLQRFTTPADIFTSYRALEQRLSSGELKAHVPFPEKGTPEQQSKWRLENNVPAKPEEYDLKFDNGVVIGDEDKPWVEQYLKAAHASNIPHSHVKDTLKWYINYKDAQFDAREQADADAARRTVDALRAEWGGEYRGNINGVEAILSLAPQGLGEKLRNSRMPDGTPLMSDPDTLKFFVHLARTINPVSTVVPAGDDASMAKSIDDELNQIRESMRSNRAAYNRDDKKQARYRELLNAKQRMGKKAA